MRAVIQRVTHASVTIDGNVKSKIGNGFLILLGVEASDSSEDVDWLVRKWQLCVCSTTKMAS